MKYTQKDVAREAGVSQALISLVLRGQPVKISEATRQRIQESMEKLGYKPKSRHIVSTHKNTLAYIRPTVTRGHHDVDWIYDTYDAFFNQFQNFLVEEAYRAGYSLLVRPFEKDANLAQWIEEQPLNGVLWHADNDELGSWIAQRFPVVQINRTSIENADSVCSDKEESIRKGMEMLHAQGHQRIIYLPNKPLPHPREDACMRVYDQFVKEHRLISCRARLDGWTDLSQSHFHDFSAIFDDDPSTAPTAVLLGDHMAFLLLSYARERGWKVPGDLSILGIDNTSATRFSDPPLSSLDTRTDEIARTAITLMFNRIKRPNRPYQHTKIAPELVERDSVSRPLSHPLGESSPKRRRLAARAS